MNEISLQISLQFVRPLSVLLESGPGLDNCGEGYQEDRNENYNQLYL